MVTKQILKQYIDLVKECEELKPKIERLEKQLEKMDNDGVVTDKVRGGEGGIQNYTIKGFPFTRYNQTKSKLITAKGILKDREKRISKAIIEVETFISSINDSHTRRLVTFRVVDGLSWCEVAEKMGGNNTEDSVRKAYDRFLEEKI